MRDWCDATHVYANYWPERLLAVLLAWNSGTHLVKRGAIPPFLHLYTAVNQSLIFAYFSPFVSLICPKCQQLRELMRKKAARLGFKSLNSLLYHGSGTDEATWHTGVIIDSSISHSVLTISPT